MRKAAASQNAILADSHMRAVSINESYPSAFPGQHGGYLQPPSGNMNFPKQYWEKEKTRTDSA